MINRKSLTTAQAAVLSAIAQAHLRGELEVALSELIAELRLGREELREVQAELFQRGLLDRTDTVQTLSLSAYGLRIAKELKGEQVEEPGDVPSMSERTAGAESNSRLFGEWKSLVENASLSIEEKGRLTELGRAFFCDPGAAPLLALLLRGRGEP